MNLKFIRVDYPRLKARVEKIEKGQSSGSGVQPGDLADVAFSGDYNDLINQPTIPPANNDVEDYRSNFETDKFIYSGFNLNLSPIIKRCKDNIEEFAQGVTDLETDWANRLSLTYV